MNLEHKRPDRIPCNPMISAASRRLVGVTYRDFVQKPEVAAKSLLTAFELIGGEGILPVTDLSIEAADFGQKIIYPEDSTPHPDYSDPLIKELSDYRKLRRIEFKRARRMQAVLETIDILLKKKELKGLVGGFCFGPLGVLSMLCGAENLFRDCIRYPLEIMSAVETISEVLIEFVEAQCDCGVSSVCIDTLFASSGSISKKLWEKLEAPFVNEMAKAIRRKQRAVVIHNCGSGPYFDSMIQFIEPVIISFAHLPDDCSNRKELKEKYGNQIVLMGHVDTSLLSLGTASEVMQECRMQIEDLAPGGGFILAAGCEFPPNGPFENAMAIVKSAELSG